MKLGKSALISNDHSVRRMNERAGATLFGSAVTGYAESVRRMNERAAATLVGSAVTGYAESVRRMNERIGMGLSGSDDLRAMTAHLQRLAEELVAGAQPANGQEVDKTSPAGGPEVFAAIASLIVLTLLLSLKITELARLDVDLASIDRFEALSDVYFIISVSIAVYLAVLRTLRRL
jgi:hypothetical protein